MVERKEAIARAMTREMGKVLTETRGDVQEGIDTAFYAATEGRRRELLVVVLMGTMCPLAIIHFGARINGKTLSDVSPMIFAMIVWSLLIGTWTLRRSVQRCIARKRQLETLLKELDDQE